MVNYELLYEAAVLLVSFSFHIFVFEILSFSLAQCKKEKSKEPEKPKQTEITTAISTQKPVNKSDDTKIDKKHEPSDAQQQHRSNTDVKKQSEEKEKKVEDKENKSKKEDENSEKNSEHTEKDPPPAKPMEELKPKKIARNAKEERIARGKEIRGKGDYPTMDDVLSDWDSEKDGKKDKSKQSEEQGELSKATTNLEEPDETKQPSKMDEVRSKNEGLSGGKQDKSTPGSKRDDKEQKSKETSKKEGENANKVEENRQKTTGLNNEAEKKEAQNMNKKAENNENAEDGIKKEEKEKENDNKGKSTSKKGASKKNILHTASERKSAKNKDHKNQKGSLPHNNGTAEKLKEDGNWQLKTDVTEVATSVGFLSAYQLISFVPFIHSVGNF
uniref:Uncharacterized protein n=1 Tax=Ascaris lumbricoides TaxID=6252 RepID=A0A0M3IA47_ASCLU